ncbi:MAG: ABC transporter ATP-binding protein [Lachnospiraceae bacterium]|nr:ABC transporter ATP-binding protein [Lachnospiraceae bacterium]
MLEVRHLTKYYEGKGKKPFCALRDIDFTLQDNEVVSLLGHNGAGKTTLVKCLASLLYPTEGQILYNGQDIYQNVRKYRSRVSYLLGGERGLYNRLTGRENAVYLAAIKGVFGRELKEKIDRYFRIFELEAFIDKRVENYSRGMKQKLHIINALLTDASVIFLDEPTAGMDPVSAQKTREVIKSMAKEQRRSILITSHMMNEVEDLSDRMLVFFHGEKRFDGSIAYFENLMQKEIVCRMRLHKTEQTWMAGQKLCAQYGDQVQLEETGEEFLFTSKGRTSEELVERYVRPLSEAVIDISFEKADLERTYIDYVASLEQQSGKEQ